MSKSNSKELQVLICGRPAGVLRQDVLGSLTFSYNEEYQGPPLSLNMPIANISYRDKVVRPYLLGLLPDSADTRNSLGRQFGVSGENPFALLSEIGLDCPGAVQLCLPEQTEASLNREMRYTEITRAEIGVRLASTVSTRNSSWQAPFEHWSLGGQQAKLALANFEGEWFACEGAAPTTQILKPGIQELRFQALNEHFCLRLARACGLSAANTSYQEFGGFPAIVVDRYDRQVEATFNVNRIHQEDFCQALGIRPEGKYASEGGPAARDILQLLQKNRRAGENILEYTAQLFFNYLVGAPDAHAKNYSILLEADGTPRMAPLYDVASALPYELQSKGNWKMAMSIGGKTEFGKVGKPHLRKYANDANIDENIAIALMGNLAEAIVKELPIIASEIASYSGGDLLGEKLVKGIGSLCEATLAKLA